ncbi:MBL fold metallo-hydrolase [Phyllobacterium sp. SYP-B3895]|uniref:MBL fold metallo-hydrolase n=1 Tax=Phyllobacterium sp. SYP-B3895 TaxID=2663240 RepID=UPI0012995FC4|nr:MBL fold metallo-hydrolase [Phyllobacterium sp. SYP-B3895]MRG57811.1 MBL fold metallo-hydrolase [Phyllobacterium sp. SYP-B3895]
MHVTFLGCGDAFGSGGRLNTCFLVDRGDTSFLIDCGASAMISIRRFGVDPNNIGAILLSHLHADHFGGLPSFILDAQLVSRRTRPLLIAGPKGLAGRLDALMEAHFPGSTKAERKFPVELIELPHESPVDLGSTGVRVTGYLVMHPSGTPSLALRMECNGKIVAYTGDTEWVEALLVASRNADLLIAEAYCFERKVRFHLDYATLREKLPLMGAKRLILTHMSPDMLGRVSELQDCEAAADGLELEIV